MSASEVAEPESSPRDAATLARRTGPLPAMHVVASREEEIARLQEHARALAQERQPLRILEAGCGRRWPIDLGPAERSLVGVDMDADALAVREADDLDRAILGDLCTLELEERSFDLIYSSFVLEHVFGAADALANFDRWLAPGGLLILRVPDRASVFGLVTRLTPFWVHVAYKRWFLGYAQAGQPGRGPYPTAYDRVISRTGIHGFVAEHDYEILEELGHRHAFLGTGVARALVRAFVCVVGVLSLGRLAWRHNGLTYVLRKR